MSLLGKKFNAPVARPMAPFFVAGIVVYYGVWKLANTLIDTDEFKNDPRNRNRPAQTAPAKIEPKA